MRPASCSLCDASLEPILLESPHWRLVLNYNQSLLDKCFLVLRRHAEDITALAAEEWADLHRQTIRVAAAIDAAFRPDRYNYAFLQNQDRHVHLHVLPRYAAPPSVGDHAFPDSGFPGHYTATDRVVVDPGTLDRIAAALRRQVEGYDATTTATAPSEPVEVVDYDASWPTQYTTERATLLDAIESVVDIQHNGSSAVPGLAAKDRVDILVGCRSLRPVSDYYFALVDHGYQLDSLWTVDANSGQQRSHRRLTTADGAAVRYTFVKRREGKFNVHLVRHGTDQWRAPIRFRDQLRANPTTARTYEKLKRRLAETTTSTDDYTLGKSAFIASVLANADPDRTTG